MGLRDKVHNLEEISVETKFVRLFMSSKFGKNTSLEFVNRGSKIENDKDIFFDSLIMNVNENQALFSMLKEKAEAKGEQNILQRCSEDTIEQISSFAEFHRVVTNIVRPGSIRRVVYHENRGTGQPILVFDVSGYKYCSNICECHQSNNIYFVANILRKHVYQKYYSCMDYKGPFIQVPSLDSILDQFDDKDNADLLLACADY